jgi:DNA repair ATPase RecN
MAGYFKGENMALTKAQIAEIDKLIAKNKKAPDIVQTMIKDHNSEIRDVTEYLKENKTLQAMLKSASHQVKKLAAAGDEATRTAIAADLHKIIKDSIKVARSNNSGD